MFSNITSESVPMHFHGIKVTFLSPSISSMKKYKSWTDEIAPANTGYNSDYAYDIEKLKDVEFIEDRSVSDTSSISLLIEWVNKRLLFLGDSIPSDVLGSLNRLHYTKDNRLNVDLVKVSHHGSKYNTSTPLMKCLKCRKFLISTNGKIHGHPDKQALARIIDTQDSPELIFNYDVYKNIFTAEELSRGQFSVKEFKSREDIII